MKKIVLFLSVLAAGFALFAESDFSIKLAPTMYQEIYALDGESKGQGKSSSDWGIGVVNYNFFGENSRFGCFEMLSFDFSSSTNVNFVLGAAIGNDVNEQIRFQGGLGAALSVEQVGSSENVSGTYVTTTRNKIRLGLTGDMAMKLTPHRLFSPVIGLSMTYNPLCITTVNVSNSESYLEAYKYYHRFAFNPYINLCINLK